MKIIYILFIITALTAAQSFEIKTPFAETKNLTVASFLNDEIGWVGGEGVILRTSNGGDDWNKFTFDRSYNFYEITIVTPLVLFASAELTKGTRDKEYFTFSSVDGGSTWDIVNIPTYMKKRYITFRDNVNGFLSGNNKMLVTTDRGATWRTATFPGDINYGKIWFVSNQIGYMVREISSTSYVIYRTTNGGGSWFYHAPGEKGEYKFFDNAAYLITENSLKRSTSNGYSWQVVRNIVEGEKIEIVNSIKLVLLNRRTGSYVVPAVRISTNGGYEWETVYTGKNFLLNGAHFSSTGTGYICGVEGYIGKISNSSVVHLNGGNIRDISMLSSSHAAVIDEFNNVYITRDGGSSWSKSNIAGPELKKIEFFNNRSLVIFAGWNTIIRSTNGGNSWHSSQSAQLVGILDYQVVENTIWAASYSGYYSRSTDFGATWESKIAPEEIKGIYFINKKNGFLSGVNNLLVTEDGGETWKTMAGGNYPEHKLNFSESGNSYGLKDGKLYLSNNGGAEWKTEPGINSLINVNYISDNSLYALSYLHNGASGNFSIKFYNNGSFSDYYSSSGINFLPAIDFKGVNNGWLAAGRNVYRFSSGNDDLYTSRGKETGGEDLNIAPDEFALFQNYPNPFNPSTTISYNIPEDGEVTLKVYDLLGNEVATLVNDYKAAGRYTVSFDASALSSGTYFYRITSHGGMLTGKMILQK
jgi:photosystem II stability/assembly factor-like uncharacterized protein